MQLPPELKVILVDGVKYVADPNRDGMPVLDEHGRAMPYERVVRLAMEQARPGDYLTGAAKEWHYYPNEGTKERVELEKWAWAAVYEDNSELLQFDNEGVYHRIAEIEQDRVKLYSLFNTQDQSKRIDMPVKPGMRLIHRYVNVKPFWADFFVRVYAFGYKLNGQCFYNFILPDGRIITSSTDEIDFTLFFIKPNI